MAIRNRERLLQKMRALPDKVRAAVGPAIAQGADEIVALQKRLAPVKSGALRKSIRAVKGTYTPENANVRGVGGPGGLVGDPDLSVHVVAGDATAWYARLVEFGTAPHINQGRFAGTQNPGARAEPYFYPAYRALKKRTTARIVRAGRKAAKDIAAGRTGGSGAAE
ncbi:HK97-gp10 family putative phage morphogenesis protein [Methylobacterium nodulans]|uniref:Phage protein, HK97 gp10 family n=1 Tax=Methylobacterium nodulans (strain LMG 21967 / CNCM I-2342 / ORS 2060) TaxID=460265 RepID=B8IAA1_METNO|nr:HK97-gp10 family putative phage morphogenesis protein [Methylobacterium nodulans]ACL59164.1 phage protein, HK97 gp10 family [Methylobacterium nodulans ORS 2060]